MPLVGIYGWSSAIFITHIGVVYQDIQLCGVENGKGSIEEVDSAVFESFVEQLTDEEAELLAQREKQKNFFIAIAAVIGFMLCLFVVFCLVLCIRERQKKKANMVVELKGDEFIEPTKKLKGNKEKNPDVIL